MEPKDYGFQRNLLFQGAIFRWTMLNFGWVSLLNQPFQPLRNKKSRNPKRRSVQRQTPRIWAVDQRIPWTPPSNPKDPILYPRDGLNQPSILIGKGVWILRGINFCWDRGEGLVFWDPGSPKNIMSAWWWLESWESIPMYHLFQKREKQSQKTSKVKPKIKQKTCCLRDPCCSIAFLVGFLFSNLYKQWILVTLLPFRRIAACHWGLNQ